MLDFEGRGTRTSELQLSHLPGREREERILDLETSRSKEVAQISGIQAIHPPTPQPPCISEHKIAKRSTAPAKKEQNTHEKAQERKRRKQEKETTHDKKRKGKKRETKETRKRKSKRSRKIKRQGNRIDKER